MSILQRRPIALLFGLSLSIPVALSAQSTSVDPAPPSAAGEQIYISNTTDREIVLHIESANVQRTEYRLAPGTASVLRGEAGDTWFNIEMEPGTDPAKTPGDMAMDRAGR
ncbi:hypothetical protein CAL14_05650 [Bordetella genomosp. 9]|uniref:hypothetical protein n=1 Tax=Bordetella genomosp. 9 TaxID=1416803 RepID=UPI000A28ED45|nr:hypothetical protein [Bordetella genomosp. 9]ARP89837.1 hypothetical protein CAL14_05650 [Bordetella genomosp. 9]